MFSVTACTSQSDTTGSIVNEDTSINDLLIDNDVGLFWTYDIDKAQELTPFEIIVPSYFPSDLVDQKEKCYIMGRLPDKWPLKDIKIDISYQNYSGDTLIGAIYITEINLTPLQLQSQNGLMLNINGTTVAHHENSIYMLSDLKTLWFRWNQDNVYIKVGISGYSYDEALEVVKSMISN